MTIDENGKVLGKGQEIFRFSNDEFCFLLSLGKLLSIQFSMFVKKSMMAERMAEVMGSVYV